MEDQSDWDIQPVEDDRRGRERVKMFFLRDTETGYIGAANACQSSVENQCAHYGSPCVMEIEIVTRRGVREIVTDETCARRIAIRDRRLNRKVITACRERGEEPPDWVISDD